METKDLPRGVLYTRGPDPKFYKGYLEDNEKTRVDVYEDDGSVYRIFYSNVASITWEERWILLEKRSGRKVKKIKIQAKEGKNKEEK